MKGEMEAWLAGEEERAAGGGSSQPMGNSAWIGEGGWFQEDGET